MAKLIRESQVITSLSTGVKNQVATIYTDAIIYVEEYATTWRVSAQFIGWACPSALDWRYTKKQCADKATLIKRFTEEFNATR